MALIDNFVIAWCYQYLLLPIGQFPLNNNVFDQSP